MTITERIEHVTTAFWVAAVGTLVSGFGWMVRIVFTNQKALAELRAEINAREASRSVDRETITEIKKDLREVRADVKQLYARTLHSDDNIGGR